MPLPFSTHTLRIERAAPGQPGTPNVDPWDDDPVTGQPPAAVATGVPAVLLKSSVTVTNDGGQRTVKVTPFRVDVDANMRAGDVAVDEAVDGPAGRHAVQWVEDRRDGNGAIDHRAGELQQIVGEV